MNDEFKLLRKSRLVPRGKSGAFGIYHRLKNTRRGVKLLESKRRAKSEFEKLKILHARFKRSPKPYYLVKVKTVESWFGGSHTFWEYGYVMSHIEGRHPPIKDNWDSPTLERIRDALGDCGILYGDLHSGNVIVGVDGYHYVIDSGMVRIRK